MLENTRNTTYRFNPFHAFSSEKFIVVFLTYLRGTKMTLENDRNAIA